MTTTTPRPVTPTPARCPRCGAPGGLYLGADPVCSDCAADLLAEAAEEREAAFLAAREDHR